jgi:hypothetical protein
MHRPLVISLHGIHTRGSWQKELTKTLNEYGFDHVPLDYGFFGVLSLLLASARRKKVDWFRDCYSQAVGDGPPPCLIAHSFGTYVASEAMRIYPGVRFDRVILCGSIVREDYPWSTVMDGGSATAIMNDYGGTDFWAGVVAWAVRNAGPSGRHGFVDDAGGRMVQRFNPDWRHSDYFFDLNYRKSWISFLRGENPASGGTPMPLRLNWRPTVTAALVVIVSAAALLGWRFMAKAYNPVMVAPSTPDPNPREMDVAGTVINGRTGAAVSGATIRAAGRTTQTDSTGTFRLSIPATNDVTIDVVAADFQAQSLRVVPPQSALVFKLGEEQ